MVSFSDDDDSFRGPDQRVLEQRATIGQAIAQRLRDSSWGDVQYQSGKIVTSVVLDILEGRVIGWATDKLAQVRSLLKEFRSVIANPHSLAIINQTTEPIAATLKVAATEGKDVAKEVVDIIEKNSTLLQQEGKTATQAICSVAQDCAWTMPESGKLINGRWYTKHALERMAPDTIEVRAILSRRAIREGKLPGSDKFKSYVDPRGIPPIVVEDTIKNGMQSLGKAPGTIDFKGNDITVSINKDTGAVVTIIPK